MTGRTRLQGGIIGFLFCVAGLPNALRVSELRQRSNRENYLAEALRHDWRDSYKDSPLKREFQYFLEHQDELVKQYRGKFIVIKDRKVIGAYDDQATAVLESQKAHDLGTFLVQRAEPGTGVYTQTFHSRVA